MKLNLGCGPDRRAGWINVDRVEAFAPDQVVDLERLPWPWPDHAAEEVMLRHVLEHLGATAQGYLGIIGELWRICRHGALVTVVVPHPRHDSFLNDPTHVRPVTPAGLELFNAEKNREWAAKGVANSQLAVALGVDFRIERVNMTPDEPWASRFKRGEITAAELNQAARQFNNVISETTVLWRVVKAAS